MGPMGRMGPMIGRKGVMAESALGLRAAALMAGASIGF